jgi:hypothetical protein
MGPRTFLIGPSLHESGRAAGWHWLSTSSSCLTGYSSGFGRVNFENSRAARSLAETARVFFILDTEYTCVFYILRVYIRPNIQRGVCVCVEIERERERGVCVCGERGWGVYSEIFFVACDLIKFKSKGMVAVLHRTLELLPELIHLVMVEFLRDVHLDAVVGNRIFTGIRRPEPWKIKV